MTVPNLQPLEGTLNPLIPLTKYSPYVGAWYLNNLIDRVPETALGYLVAQGWQIVNTYAEEEGGQTFYTMARQTMNSPLILQGLLNEYVQAYNEGRSANATRYEDVISYWVDAITRSREHYDLTGDVSDAHLVIFTTQMDAMVDGVETEIALAKAEMTDIGDEIADQLDLYVSKLNSLEPIYDTHEAVAEALLVGLGTTELARINEQFDNALAKARQGLVSRGLYSSVMYAQLEARIERERNEAIGALNDRLAREKLENEHKLYEQEIALKSLVLDGKLRYTAGSMQRGQFIIDNRKSMALAVMQARMERINSRMGIRDKEERLMLAQLDGHNNLAQGLWGFVERREDSYPSLESISKIVAGLGDAGGSWIQP